MESTTCFECAVGLNRATRGITPTMPSHTTQTLYCRIQFYKRKAENESRKDDVDRCKERPEGTLFLFGSVYLRGQHGQIYIYKKKKPFIYCNPSPAHLTSYSGVYIRAGTR